jgi:hypothetical protein
MNLSITSSSTQGKVRRYKWRDDGRQTFVDKLNDPGRNCTFMVYKVTLLKTFKDIEVVNMLCESWD